MFSNFDRIRIAFIIINNPEIHYFSSKFLKFPPFITFRIVTNTSVRRLDLLPMCVIIQCHLKRKIEFLGEKSGKKRRKWRQEAVKTMKYYQSSYQKSLRNSPFSALFFSDENEQFMCQHNFPSFFQCNERNEIWVKRAVEPWQFARNLHETLLFSRTISPRGVQRNRVEKMDEWTNWRAEKEQKSESGDLINLVYLYNWKCFFCVENEYYIYLNAKIW